MRKDIDETASTIASVVPGLISGAELEFFSGAKVTNCQLIAIMAIFQAGRCTMGQLAKKLHVSTPTVTGLVDRLTRLRLAKRVHSRKDRRKVYIDLSEKGRALIAGFKGMVRRRWSRLLTALNPADVKNFRRIFEEVRRAMERQKDEENI